MSEERKVFVSYSRKDKEKVFPLVKDLEKSLGCKFWIDWTGIESGNPNFYNEIAQGIDDAKVVLYMHTTNAAKSIYTQRELAYAEKVRTKIIPVLFEDLTKGLALQFAATNFIDTRKAGQIQKLINDLRGYLNLSNSAHVVPQTMPQELKPAELKPEAKPKPTSGNSEERKVFVSYSRADKDKVLPLVKNLEKSVGTKFWIDSEGIERTDQFEEVIIRALDQAQVVLFMLSDNSQQSEWTKKELVYAKNTGKRVVPIVLYGGELKGWFRFEFGRLNHIDATQEDQLQRLIVDIRRWLHVEMEQTSSGQKVEDSQPPATSAPNTIAGHQFVDLGLSVKWATCNVGANSPEEYGDDYAWGETSIKSSYTEDNCETWRKDVGDIKGTCRDVAHVKWGGSWRMPTRKEFEELINNCTFKWTTRNGSCGRFSWTDGVKGIKFMSKKNGNSIFLPATGCHKDHFLLSEKEECCYWSSTPDEGCRNTGKSYALLVPSDDISRYSSILGPISWKRSYGLSVRPVTE